jgi:arylformamidase
MNAPLHPYPERPIAHGLSRAHLASDYDVEASVPDLPGYMRQFINLSDEARLAFDGHCRLDASYGPLPAQKLDIFMPSSQGNAPILVFFHGGAWKGSNKECRAFPALTVCPRGAVWISVEYPLAPDSSLETQTESAQRAIAWIVDNASSFGGDARRVLVMGHSAGGHLATMGLFRMLHAQPDLAKNFELLTISAVFDLEPMMFTKVNDWLKLDPPRVLQHSPISQIPPQSPALHALAGGSEPGVFIRQSLDMVGAYASRGFPSRFSALPHRNHFSVLEEFSRQDSPLHQALMAFIKP